MEFAEIPERATIDDAAPGVDGGLLTLELLQMPPKPWLASRQEAVDVALRVRPAASGCERDRYHDAASGIDGDPQ